MKNIFDWLFDRELEGSVEEKLVRAKKQRNELFVGFVIFAVFIVICLGALIFVNNAYTEGIETYFSEQYNEVYEPVGKERIDKIVLEVNSLSKSQDKLNAIADWVIDDFVNFLEYERWNESYPHTKKLGLNYRYDYSGRIRAENGVYCQNPNWIAYHKFGACGELSSLFSYVANQTGFETRLISATYADRSNNHQWVEVNVDGVWMYYDPTIYWSNYHNIYGKVLDSKWYGTFDEQVLWNVTASSVIDKSSGKDICSEHYPNIKQVTGLDAVLYCLSSILHLNQ